MARSAKKKATNKPKRCPASTSQERRLFTLAEKLAPRLKKKTIPLRGGHREIGYDFTAVIERRGFQGLLAELRLK